MRDFKVKITLTVTKSLTKIIMADDETNATTIALSESKNSEWEMRKHLSTSTV